MSIIEVENLYKCYDNGIQALNGLSLHVQAGEVFCLLGQNGAGKSTLIHILTTFLSPTSGHVRILDLDMHTHIEQIRPYIACVAQKTSIDTHLSLKENMMFQSKLYRIPELVAKSRMTELIECFELERYLDYPVSSYSGGIKRRLDIALNLMSSPKILFLDEPTVGMDVDARRKMWRMIHKIKEELGTTIFLTTHYLEEAETLSDTICIMKEGKEVIQGNSKQLKKYLNQKAIKISLSSLQESISLQELMKKTDIDNLYTRDENLYIQDTSFDITYYMKWLLEHQIPIQGIEIVEPTIEDIFIKIIHQKEEFTV